jgi:hypothetical protein
VAWLAVYARLYHGHIAGNLALLESAQTPQVVGLASIKESPGKALLLPRLVKPDVADARPMIRTTPQVGILNACLAKLEAGSETTAGTMVAAKAKQVVMDFIV